MAKTSPAAQSRPDPLPQAISFTSFYLQNGVFLRVGLPGLEPGTSSLSEKRSNRLSYRPSSIGVYKKRAAGIMYNTVGPLTSRLKTGEAGSKIGLC